MPGSNHVLGSNHVPGSNQVRGSNHVLGSMESCVGSNQVRFQSWNHVPGSNQVRGSNHDVPGSNHVQIMLGSDHVPG